MWFYLNQILRPIWILRDRDDTIHNFRGKNSILGVRYSSNETSDLYLEDRWNTSTCFQLISDLADDRRFHWYSFEIVRVRWHFPHFPRKLRADDQHRSLCRIAFLALWSSWYRNLLVTLGASVNLEIIGLKRIRIVHARIRRIRASIIDRWLWCSVTTPCI